MSDDLTDSSDYSNKRNNITDKTDGMIGETRISRGILGVLSKYNVSALLISDPVNLRYLSGFTGGEGYLFISGDNRYLVVDSRYGVRAHEECRDADIGIIVENDRIKAINSLIKKDNVTGIALEGKHITYDEYKIFSKSLDVSLSMCVDEVDRLRLIKNPFEISLIKKAEDIGCRAFEHIIQYIKPGVAERDIALELEYYMKKNGAEALSFETIVASGVNSSCPHASVSDRKIANGDFVTLDFGCVYKGYCSDMTRTVAVGHIYESRKKIYDTVLSAQLYAIENIRAGITGKVADSYARDIISAAGYGKYFGHGTGHGVGLYIHELPRISPLSDDVLDAGMVFSVEPGIYIDGECGVRIEDVVTLTEDGLVDLTEASKGLVIL